MAAINQAVPFTLAEDDGTTSTEFGVYRGGTHEQAESVRLSFNGNGVFIHLPIQYRVDPPVVSSCGYDEPARRANIVIFFNVEWHPVEWRLMSQNVITYMEAVDRCIVWGLDITGIALEKAQSRLDVVRSRVQAFFSDRANLTGRVTSIWNRLNQSIRIGQAGVLHINPAELRVSNPTGSGTVLSVDLSVAASPVFRWQPPGGADTAEPPVTPRPLPPPRLGITGGQFALVVQSALPFRDAEAMLHRALYDKRFDVPCHRGKYLIVEKVRLLPAGYGVVAAIDVKGSAKGVLLFDVMPRLSTAADGAASRDTVLLETADYRLSSTDKLANLLNTPCQVQLAEVIKSAFSLGLEQSVNSIKGSVNEALQTLPALTISGGLQDIEYLGATSDPLMLRFSTLLRGRLSIAPQNTQ